MSALGWYDLELLLVFNWVARPYQPGVDMSFFATTSISAMQNYLYQPFRTIITQSYDNFLQQVNVVMDLNFVGNVRIDLDSQMKELSSCKSRVHKCGSCDKSFQSNQQLIQHSLVHTNKRSYACSYCDKTFKQKCHVVQHERIHTGKSLFSVKLHKLLIKIFNL